MATLPPPNLWVSEFIGSPSSPVENAAASGGLPLQNAAVDFSSAVISLSADTAVAHAQPAPASRAAATNSASVRDRIELHDIGPHDDRDQSSGTGASDKLTGRRFSERMDPQGELTGVQGETKRVSSHWQSSLAEPETKARPNDLALNHAEAASASGPLLNSLLHRILEEVLALQPIDLDPPPQILETFKVGACQCCDTVTHLICGPSRFGEETWACDECWNPAEQPLNARVA